ncbi:MAG: 4-hydroxybenzoate octaprenyltransferase [Rhodocyclaceae bacterium]|jgi:4-hydroxybenzoate polyprenyltransferase|nr:4-hydroxybenzoate octaprenyltransferase [Rhodocyclaceae bacterium]
MSELTLRQRLDAYERLMRLDKPIGTLLLLWPTMWAVWIAAEGMPSLFIVWIFALGTLLMRSAGVVMNDYADRHFDPHVERTKNRPLAAGIVSEREALLLAGGVTLCAFLLILPLHKLVWALSVVALFLAASYPLTKRFLAIPQAYLGIAFGFGIPMAFAAQLYTVPPLAWAMLAANIFWAIGYDTCYAMVDRDDDLKIGIKTSAITFGRYDVAAVMGAYAITLAILAWVGAQAGRGIYFFAGLAVAAGMMLRHYYWIRGRERMACFRAFMDNNWVGAAIFAGLFADYALRSGRWPVV